MVTLTQRNYFKVGDTVEIFGPNIETFSFKIPNSMYNEDNERVEIANHPKEIIRFELDKEVYKDDIMRIKVF
jgi:putative protease